MSVLIFSCIFAFFNYKLAEAYDKDSTVWAILGFMFGILGTGALALILVLEGLKENK